MPGNTTEKEQFIADVIDANLGSLFKTDYELGVSTIEYIHTTVVQLKSHTLFENHNYSDSNIILVSIQLHDNLVSQEIFEATATNNENKYKMASMDTFVDTLISTLLVQNIKVEIVVEQNYPFNLLDIDTTPNCPQDYVMQQISNYSLYKYLDPVNPNIRDLMLHTNTNVLINTREINVRIRVNVMNVDPISSTELPQYFTEWEFDGCMPRLYSCQKIVLPRSDYSLLDDNTSIAGNDLTILKPGIFAMFPDVIIMCRDRLPDSTSVSVIIEQLLTTVCLFLSIACLIFTATTYICFKKLHSLPGNCLISFVCSLASAQVLFIISSYVTPWKSACFTVAILQHYCWLVSFLWTFLLTLDTFQTFKTFPRFPEERQGRMFMLFSVFAWGVPAILVASSVLLDHFDIFSMGYGQHQVCWIRTRLGIIVTFAVPLASVLVTNLILLISVVLIIHRTMNLSETLSLSYSGRVRLVIYLRLTAVVGLTWIFGFLANIPTLGFLAYPYVVLNGAQGVYVCVAFCTSTVVRGQYSRWWAGVNNKATNLQFTEQQRSTGDCSLNTRTEAGLAVKNNPGQRE
jgi:hypothetical protein